MAGAIQYVVGLAAVLALAFARESALYLAAAVLVVMALAGLTLRALARVRGLSQRVGEVALFAALVYALSD